MKLVLIKNKQQNFLSIELDQDDRKMLEATEFVLRPIVYATQIISGSKYPTVGISYFAIVQIREFRQDVKDVKNFNDSKILHCLKSLLLKQARKYFTDDGAQLEVMKVRFFFLFLFY